MGYYLALFYCFLNLIYGVRSAIPSYYIVYCVSDSVCELFGETIRYILGVVVIILLNVVEVFSVGGGSLLDRPCMVFQRVCVLCL